MEKGGNGMAGAAYDNKIMFAGGKDESGPSDLVEVFDKRVPAP